MMGTESMDFPMSDFIYVIYFDLEQFLPSFQLKGVSLKAKLDLNLQCFLLKLDTQNHILATLGLVLIQVRDPDSFLRFLGSNAVSFQLTGIGKKAKSDFDSHRFSHQKNTQDPILATFG